MTDVNFDVKLYIKLDMTEIFSQMNKLEKQSFQTEFALEMRRLIAKFGAQLVYDKLGMTRENGRRCQAGRLPARKPGVLRKAIELGFVLTYKGQPLTIEMLESLQIRTPPEVGFVQLELFTEAGVTYEIIRKKTESEVAVEIKIRRA